MEGVGIQCGIFRLTWSVNAHAQLYVGQLFVKLPLRIKSCNEWTFKMEYKKMTMILKWIFYLLFYNEKNDFAFIKFNWVNILLYELYIWINCSFNRRWIKDLIDNFRLKRLVIFFFMNNLNKMIFDPNY